MTFKNRKAAVAGYTLMLTLLVSAAFSIRPLEGAHFARLPSSTYGASDLCRLDWKGFQEKLESRGNLLTFENPGGPMGIGLCWWHSRFQRNANYLTEFSHGERSGELDKKAIKKIISGDAVVSIAGHGNLEQFSTEHHARIAESLGNWQLTDSFLKQTWIRGAFMGSSHPSADELKKQMENLYDKVAVKKFVIFQMLQMRGTAAHAWLVKGMSKTESGYRLRVLDSNLPNQLYDVDYSAGDREVVAGPFAADYPRFAPDTQRSSNLLDYEKALRKHCKSKGGESPLAKILSSDLK